VVTVRDDVDSRIAGHAGGGHVSPPGPPAADWRIRGHQLVLANSKLLPAVECASTT